MLHRAVALSDDLEVEIDEYSGTDFSALDTTPVTVAAPLAEDLKAEPLHAPVDAASLPSDLQAYLDAQEREILVRALRQTAFNRTLAANLLGLTLRQIRYRIARLKIDAPFAAGSEDSDE